MNGDSREIDETAAAWVARMDSDEWDGSDDAALGRWLAEDTRHAGALLQAQALWSVLGGEEDASAAPAPPPAVYVVPRRRVLIGASAAVAASLAGGIGFVMRGPRYATDIGEIRRVPLADGSTAAINTDSLISVSLGTERRVVTLEQGEAYFEVAKDRARPFLVEAGKVRVRAVGTAFSVRRRERGAEVIVTEGVVEAWADGAEGHKVRISAGGMASVSDDAAIEVQAPARANVDRALAWRSGNIDLVGTQVGAAAAEFNRYNRRRIVIVDPALAAEQVDGVFRANDPEGFAKVLGGSFAVPVDNSDPAEIRVGAGVRSDEQ